MEKPQYANGNRGPLIVRSVVAIIMSSYYWIIWRCNELRLRKERSKWKESWERARKGEKMSMRSYEQPQRVRLWEVSCAIGCEGFCLPTEGLPVSIVRT